MRKVLVSIGIYLGVLIAVSLLIKYLDTTIINSIALKQLKNEAGSELPLRIYYFVRNNLWIPFAVVGIGLCVSLIRSVRKVNKKEREGS